MTYPDTNLFIDGHWRPALSGERLPVLDPATGAEIGSVAKAGRADLDAALAAAEASFAAWKKTSPLLRAQTMRKAADLLRARADEIAAMMSAEQGKPLPQAKGETLAGADIGTGRETPARPAPQPVQPGREGMEIAVNRRDSRR